MDDYRAAERRMEFGVPRHFLRKSEIEVREEGTSIHKSLREGGDGPNPCRTLEQQRPERVRQRPVRPDS
ncbi:hypothetical protein KIN20_022626 [Parelaphostrongylus tenuis]|uniref:Uncharacterized protein n=1 Tax=Parelaphostrongylus tenuis TaxID=148309 RepID=A0AAD5QWV6_PARTN|nr:hypothetical protein KIN20_022626 [Parelaphostrongylus tenuis]